MQLSFLAVPCLSSSLNPLIILSSMYPSIPLVCLCHCSNALSRGCIIHFFSRVVAHESWIESGRGGEEKRREERGIKRQWEGAMRRAMHLKLALFKTWLTHVYYLCGLNFRATDSHQGSKQSRSAAVICLLSVWLPLNLVSQFSEYKTKQSLLFSWILSPFPHRAKYIHENIVVLWWKIY